eukprot:SAG31_NODE_2424_length_5724_cov_35.068978_5_plen_119_part_00
MPAAATLQLMGVRIAGRRASEYEPAVLWNDGTTLITQSEIVGSVQSTVATGAMTAFASSSGGAIVNGANGTLSFGPGCNISNNTASASAFTAAFASGSASAGAIYNQGGNVSFGQGGR